MKCEKGHENPEGAKFCRDCGLPIDITLNVDVISFKRTFRRLHPITYISFCIIVTAVPLFFVSLMLGNYFETRKWDTEEKYKDKLPVIINAVVKINGFDEYHVDKIKQTFIDRWNNITSFGDINSYDEGEEEFVKKIPETDYNILEELQNKYFYYRDFEDLFDMDYPGVIPMIFLVASLASILSIVYFFVVYNRRWKKFELQGSYNTNKKILKQYAFFLNSTSERVRIKEKSNGELFLHIKDSGKKACFYLVQDIEGGTELIGEKYHSMDLIRHAFGKDLHFIEN